MNAHTSLYHILITYIALSLTHVSFLDLNFHCLTVPYLFLYYLTLLCLTLPSIIFCLVLPYIALSHILPCCILPYLVFILPCSSVPYLVLPCFILPWFMLPNVTLPSLILPDITLPYLTWPFLPYLDPPVPQRRYLQLASDRQADSVPIAITALHSDYFDHQLLTLGSRRHWVAVIVLAMVASDAGTRRTFAVQGFDDSTRSSVLTWIRMTGIFSSCQSS